MRAIVTVTGLDRVGIIAEICVLLAKYGVNILDIRQTVMQEFFSMSMLVDISGATAAYDELTTALSEKGKDMAMTIRIQREDIFYAMHRI